MTLRNFASQNYYPDNRPVSFTNVLPKTLELTSNYKVALVSAIFVGQDQPHLITAPGLVQPQIFGDSYLPLLAIAYKNNGVFKKQYHQLANTSIKEISIEITTPTGAFILPKDVPTLITLHFKQT